ncbi:MAG: DNA primase [Crenarchaeota archaeon]|nr:DNA primase [Thermoproteota archaeon]
MKYLIKAKLEVEGPVDKHDVIGAIFGQTENLFGQDFDLRELQERGRIGRIQVDIKHVGDKTVGEVTVPSNLDRVETALLASMLEAVDKVGPYRARIRVYDIIDVRAEKIKKIIERAREILRLYIQEKAPDLKEVLRQVAEAVKRAEITTYGPERLPAGPDVGKADEIIIVEGRADVINLLRYGYRNVIALEGARGGKIPETIIKLAREKKAILFVDGDHGGDLIIREVLKHADIDYIARAPPGKEVEELTGKEIAKALKNLIPARQYLELMEKRRERGKPARAVAKPTAPPTPPQPTAAAPVTAVVELPKEVLEKAKELPGTLEALIYDDKWNLVARVPVKDLYDTLAKMEPGKAYAVIYDGIITQRMLDIAAEKGIKLLIATKIGSIERRPQGVQMLTFDDILTP